MSALKQQMGQGLLTFYRHYERYVIGLVCLLILGAGYTFVLSSRLTEFRSQKLVDLKLKSAELNERRDYASRLQTMVNQFAAEVTADDELFMERVMPSEPSIPELLALLSGAAAEGGFQVASFSYNEEVPVSSTGAATVPSVLQQATAGTASVGEAATTQVLGRRLTLQLSLRATNTYPSLRQLLNVVESSNRILDISSLQFSLRSPRQQVVPGAAGSNSTSGQYQLSVSTVYLPISSR